MDLHPDLELQVAVAKVSKYAVSESGDTVELIERPHGGLSLVLVDGQRSGKSAKAISNIVARKAVSLLADGVRVVQPLGGPGCFCRPSFRDPPQPRHSNLVLEPGDDPLPPTLLFVSEMTLHPLPGDQWSLECDGTLRRGAESGPLVLGALIRTSPRDLVERCVARAGPSVQSHRGVQTPALLFNGLEVSF